MRNSSSVKLLSWEIPLLGNTILLSVVSRYSSWIQEIRPAVCVDKLVTNVITNYIGAFVQHSHKVKQAKTLHS